MDSAIAKSSIKEPVTVYRGFGGSAFRGAKEGDTVQDKGFVSTSFQQKIASKFADGGMMKLSVPKGAKGAMVDALFNGGESELVLPRNSKFKIKKISGSGKSRIIEADWIP